MPHMNGGTEMAESYGGLEFQQISVELSQDGGNADQPVEAFSNIEPVEPQGLDNDEIAELVDIEVVYILFVRSNSVNENQTEQGNVLGEFAIEVNPGTRDGTLPQLTTDGSPFQNGENRETLDNEFIYEDDEPGRLFFAEVGVPAGFSSGGEGRGGAGDEGESHRYQKNYRNDYGRGPAVDANDDLGVFCEIGNENVTSEVQIKMHAQLAWDIHTVEGQRGQFHLP